MHMKCIFIRGKLRDFGRVATSQPFALVRDESSKAGMSPRTRIITSLAPVTLPLSPPPINQPLSLFISISLPSFGASHPSGNALPLHKPQSFLGGRPLYLSPSGSILCLPPSDRPTLHLLFCVTECRTSVLGSLPSSPLLSLSLPCGLSSGGEFASLPSTVHTARRANFNAISLSSSLTVFFFFLFSLLTCLEGCYLCVSVYVTPLVTPSPIPLLSICHLSAAMNSLSLVHSKCANPLSQTPLFCVSILLKPPLPPRWIPYPPLPLIPSCHRSSLPLLSLGPFPSALSLKRRDDYSVIGAKENLKGRECEHFTLSLS